MRKCSKCGAEKSVRVDSRRLDGIGFHCAPCGAKASRDRRARTKTTDFEIDTSAFQIITTTESMHAPQLPTAGKSLALSVVSPSALSTRRKVLAIGDAHFPFHDHAAISRCMELARDLQPDVIIQVGDLYDLLAFSKYPRSLNVMRPSDELTHGREYAEFMWRQLQKAAPKAACYQLWGNHDDRAAKRILECAPEAEGFVRKGMRDMMTFDGVTSVDSSKHELQIDDVLYMHGHRKFGEHAKWNRQNTVTGHLHKGGTVFIEDVWELNTGWVGDVLQPAFSYKSQMKHHGLTLGAGWVDQFGPRFIQFK